MTYIGVLLGKAKLAIALLAATVPAHGHVAVWDGAQNAAATRWVQAGIAQENGRRFAYLEWRGPLRRGFRTWPPPASATVRVLRRGGAWRATIAGRSSDWTWIPSGERLAALELTPGAHAAALMGGRKVGG